MTRKREGSRVIDRASKAATPRAAAAAGAALCVLCALAGLLGLFAAPALALEGHAFSSSFSGSGSSALSAPKGVAINQGNGHVYVVDSAHNRVEVFSESGTFLSSFGSTGKGNGQFESPTGIAVANAGPDAGYSYVIDGASKGSYRVEIFNEAGVYQSQVSEEEIEKVVNCGPLTFLIYGVTVDNSGNLWIVAADCGSQMLELPVGGSLKVAFASSRALKPGLDVTAAGEFWAGNGNAAVGYGPSGERLQPAGVYEREHGEVAGVAVNRANGDLYIARETEVAHFIAPGSWPTDASDSFGAAGPGAIVKGAGVAFNETSHDVYAADASSSRIDVFTPTVLPSPTVEAASAVTQTSATLHGTVNPENLEVSACSFEYWLSGTESEKKTASCSPAPGGGGAAVAVSAAIGGLAPKTTYVYRLVATNANGTASASARGKYAGEEFIENKLGELRTLAPLLTLSVKKAGGGEGTVKSTNLTGIDCGAECSHEFEEGTEVDLEASAAAGSKFSGFSGAGCSGSGVCKVKMSASEEVTATFTPEGVFPLTLAAEGGGSGAFACRVEGGPEEPCAAEYIVGKQLEVIAKPASGSEFIEWTHACSGEAACKLTIAEPTEVGAIFGLESPPLIKAQSTKASAVGKTGATLEAEIDPEHLATTYEFQYITEEAFKNDGNSFGAGTQTTPTGSLPATITYKAAAKAVSNLIPATLYRFRAVARNAHAPAAGVMGEAGSLETLPYAAIEATFASEVAATSATIATRINPLGDGTRFHFEYLSQAEYEANGNSFSGQNPAAVVPVPDADLGSGSEAVSSSHHLQGLAPHTAYRFRVLLTNALTESLLPGGYAGPTRSFTTQAPGPLALPDERGWELVSPAQKQGALIYPPGGSGLSNGAEIQAAANGEAITYVANAPTEALPEGYANGVQVLSRRAPGGWSTRDIATPHQGATRGSVGQGEEYRLFSTDLGRGLVQPMGTFTARLSAAATEQGPYLRTDFAAAGGICTESCYRPLVISCPAIGPCPAAVGELADTPPGTTFGQPCPRGEGSNFFCGPIVDAASPDLAHVVLTAPVLLEGAPAGALYEWSAEAAPSEALKVASVLPGGSAVAGELAGVKGGGFRHAVAGDGSVFWEAGGHLYLRKAGGEASIQLDRVISGAGAGAGAITFEDAALDGSRAFFSDSQALSAASGSEDLYEWRSEGTAGCAEAEGCITDLTPTGGSEPLGLKGTVIGASAEGSYLYFAANGALASNEGADGSHAKPGNCSQSVGAASHEEQSCNLYLYHAGTTTFIATLAGNDLSDWGGQEGSLRNLAARVSPDGRWLAFTSQRSLTGYDNHDAASGEPDQEAFLYQAGEGGGEGRLVCASCNPSGARPQGAKGEEAKIVNNDEVYGGATWLAAALPDWTPNGLHRSLYQPRYLSDSGRLFFNSPDALVPHDTNGTWDVYQYEPQGVGSCAAAGPSYVPSAGGCVDLISSGAAAKETAFLDASESGNDVFFLTAGQLTRRDADMAYDVYDARVGGGEAESVHPVECEGDACQSPAKAPEDATPGSLTYSGPGNEHPQVPAPRLPKCRKGFALRHGRCMRRRQTHKRHRGTARASNRKRGGAR